MNKLNERKLKILHAIIDDFIQNAEPVGSRSISKKFNMDISPATVRNEMSDLEEMGYLTHPHTSAGRVPSDKAYRLYVEEMMEGYIIPSDQKEMIRERLISNAVELDRMLEKVTNLLSEMTNLTAFAITPKDSGNVLKYVNVLPVDKNHVIIMIVSEAGKISNTVVKIGVPYEDEKLQLLSKVLTYNYKGKTLSDIVKLDIIKSFENDIEAMHKLVDRVVPNFISTLEDMLNVELYYDGLTNIFSLPEYNDLEKAKIFLEKLSRKEHLTELLVNRNEGLSITIGDENFDQDMQDCTLITATYKINGKVAGTLGVVGPTRMQYNQVKSLMEFMSENINDAFCADEDNKTD